ncbi:MAG: hypothetical protein ACRYG7_39620 [Janthinobacterium lividum]
MKKRTLDELIKEYRELYEILIVTPKSRGIASDLWDNWEKDGVTRPDIQQIATDVDTLESKFFEELTALTSELEGRPLHVAYFSFITLHYNFAASTAVDGYLVLVDEAFFRLAFFLVFALYAIAQMRLPEATRADLKHEILEVVVKGYHERDLIAVDQLSTLFTLLNSSYDIAEGSNYLFQSIKTFVLGHELGHHARSHVDGTEQIRYALSEQILTFEIDNRSWENEFEADEFGYRVFLAALNTAPEREYTHLKYVFPFGPLLFFDICERLAIITGDSKVVRHSKTHPPLQQRREALIKKFAIDTQDPLYVEVYKALDFLFSPLANQH